MKMDLKSRKGRLILFGSIATVAVVATAIAVPVALLVPKTGTTQPAVKLTPLEQEVADFNKVYNNALSINTSTPELSIAVNQYAFLNRTDLPADFKLPTEVTKVGAKAFKGAKLPRGFTIPTSATSIDATAFADLVFDEDLYWTNSKAEAGAKVDTLDKNDEWTTFNANYSNTLSGKALVDEAFKGRTVLPSGFALPSFLTKIGARAFLNISLPNGFQLPATITSIGENALAGTTLPNGFQIPKNAALGDLSFDRAVFPANFALPDEMTVVGFEGNAVGGKAVKPFNAATFATGFTLKNTVTAVSSTAFSNAKLPLGFAIPATAKLYSLGSDGNWVSNSSVKLADVVLPNDTAWSGSSGAVPGAAIISYTSADQVRDFNAKYNNALVVSGNTVTVKADAFLNKNNLPADFALPSSVTNIDARAFKGAKLPFGFTIPAGVTGIDATAFADVVFDDAYYWNESVAKAGAKVDVVENNTEWKAFTALYPNTLSGKSIVHDAFANRTDLPASFALPSFLTIIGGYAFRAARLPAGFTLPKSISSVGVQAFSSYALPDSFVFPENAKMNDSVFFRATFPQNFALPDSVTTIGFENKTVGGRPITLFYSATFQAGFTLKPTVTAIAWDTFYDAYLPLNFEIPAGVHIYKPDNDGIWSTNPSVTLDNVNLPPNSKWDKGSAVAGAKIVPTTTTTNP